MPKTFASHSTIINFRRGISIEIDKKIYRSAISIGVIQIHTHTCKCIYTYSFSTLNWEYSLELNLFIPLNP